jgi:hypothetical protein
VVKPIHENHENWNTSNKKTFTVLEFIARYVAVYLHICHNIFYYYPIDKLVLNTLIRRCVIIIIFSYMTTDTYLCFQMMHRMLHCMFYFVIHFYYYVVVQLDTSTPRIPCALIHSGDQTIH